MENNMTSIDEKIKQALSDEYKDIIAENDKIDANPFRQMGVGFSSKMSWMYILVMVFTSLFAIMMFYSIYQFYYETEIKSLIGWGVSIIVFGLVTQISKMWYWSELGRNRVIREIKLLELQIANLAEKQKK
jgi:magnesium-transporting ATPase (P-type)